MIQKLEDVISALLPDSGRSLGVISSGDIHQPVETPKRDSTDGDAVPTDGVVASM